MKNKFNIRCPNCDTKLELTADSYVVKNDNYNSDLPSDITLAVCMKCNMRFRIAIPLDMTNLIFIRSMGNEIRES